MVDTGVESEVKLEAGAGFVLPSLDGVVDGVTAHPLPERRLTACYVDTTDLRLLRNGVSLRHRHEVGGGADELSEWTLKLPIGADGPMVVRRELRWAGPAGDLPAEAAALVRSWTRGADLDVITRLVTLRHRTLLHRRPVTGPGRAVAAVDDDLVSVMDGPRLVARFRQVEVEATAGEPATRKVVRAVVARLESAGAMAGDDRPKVVRALGAPATAPPDVVHVALPARATIGAVASAAIADGYLRLARHHVGVRLDEDPEDVHQARVATRRLRSDLRMLRPVLDPAWVASVRDDLGWLAGALGAVRDADVLADRLRRAGASLPIDDGPGVDALLARLAEQRRSARTVLVEALDSPRYARLLDRLAGAVHALPAAPLPTAPHPSAAEPPAADVAPSAGPGPAAGKAPAAGGAPAPGLAAASGEGPAAGDAPVSGEAPVSGDAPASGNVPAAGVAGAFGDAPAAGVAGAFGDAPVAGEAPVSGDAPAAGAAPAFGGVPAAGAAPAVGGVAGSGDGRPGSQPGLADQRAAAVLPGLVARPWRHLRNGVRALGDAPADEELHRLRVQAKRLRYACETATPVCGRDARALGRAAADLQSVLGDLNDAAVAGAWLRNAAAGAPPAVALVAGQLVAAQTCAAAEARAAWPQAWTRLAGKKLTAWVRDATTGTRQGG